MTIITIDHRKFTSLKLKFRRKSINRKGLKKKAKKIIRLLFNYPIFENKRIIIEFKEINKQKEK